MVLVYVVYIVVNALMIMTPLSNFLGIEGVIENYIDGDTRLVEFLITAVLYAIITYPLYQFSKAIYISKFREISKVEVVRRLVSLFISIALSLIVSITIAVLVNQVFSVSKGFIVLNLVVIFTAYLFKSNRYLEYLVELISFKTTLKDVKYVDTSVLIDGRIKDLAKVLGGELVVLPSVIEELHKMSDETTDYLKRKKGQKGLETFKYLRENEDNYKIVVKEDREYINKGVDEIIIEDIEGEELINATVLTLDYNLGLNIQGRGYKVINFNEIMNMLKLDVEEGDKFYIVINKKGQKNGQGIGTLEDGTMVVVDGGGEHIGDKVYVEVYNKINKDSGAIIFCNITSDNA